MKASKDPLTLINRIKLQLRCAASLVVFSLLSSCSPEVQVASREDAINAYLNQRNYDQAIPLIKVALKENPRSDRHRILLASALSGSIGIDTVECFDVLRPKIFDRPMGKTESLPLVDAHLLSGDAASGVTEHNNAKRQALLALEKEFLKFARQASETLEIAYRLPHVAITKRDRIVSGLSILAEIEPSSAHYQTA
ncbi:MAG: hypothetical protein NTV34_01580, partial [Proteobacteria bacterium]|nr:hypothetical protein [Pseudomonadota bacterium]